jgi:hypothetical protein
VRKYRADGSSTLKRALVAAVADVFDRHTDGLVARDLDAIAAVRQEIVAVLQAAERAPERFPGRQRRIRRQRNAGPATGAAHG